MSDVCLCARIVIPGAGLPFDSSVFPSAAPGRSDRWVWRSKAAGSRSGMLVKEAGRRRSCGTEAIRWGVNPAGPHVCGVKIIALFVQWLTEKMRQAASRNSIQPRLILILHGYSSPVQVSAAFSWNQLPNLSTGDWPELQSPPFDSSCCAADTDTATQKSAASLLRLVRWHVHALSWNVEAWTRFCSARGGCAQCGLTSSPQKSFHSWCF